MQKALENKIKKMQTTRYVRELTLNYYNHKFSSENLNWINLALPINQSIKQTNLSSATEVFWHSGALQIGLLLLLL